MADELDLSAAQREELSAVLERQESRLAEAMAEARPRLQQILEDTHREIRAILTPEQQERFDRTWMASRARHRLLLHGPSDSTDGFTEEGAAD
jgi:Spy/CpxP family protein refolding chaperone